MSLPGRAAAVVVDVHTPRDVDAAERAARAAAGTATALVVTGRDADLLGDAARCAQAYGVRVAVFLRGSGDPDDPTDQAALDELVAELVAAPVAGTTPSTPPAPVRGSPAPGRRAGARAPAGRDGPSR